MSIEVEIYLPRHPSLGCKKNLERQEKDQAGEEKDSARDVKNCQSDDSFDDEVEG